MKSQTQIHKLSSGGTAVYKMIDDNISEIIEDQNNMIMANNSLLGLSGKTELF